MSHLQNLACWLGLLDLFLFSNLSYVMGSQSCPVGAKQAHHHLPQQLVLTACVQSLAMALVMGYSLVLVGQMMSQSSGSVAVLLITSLSVTNNAPPQVMSAQCSAELTSSLVQGGSS